MKPYLDICNHSAYYKEHANTWNYIKNQKSTCHIATILQNRM